MDQQASTVYGSSIVLPMDFTIECVHALHNAFTAALARPLPLELDAAQVDRCDTAGLQLLLAARRSGAARQQTICIAHAPPQLVAAADVLGLAGALGLTRAQSADA